jgi:hypothetical protein
MVTRVRAAWEQAPTAWGKPEARAAAVSAAAHEVGEFAHALVCGSSLALRLPGTGKGAGGVCARGLVVCLWYFVVFADTGSR